jgi:hypothetical protein
MSNSNVPPKSVDALLFGEMPEDLKALNLKARKEARLNARREYVNRYGYPQQRQARPPGQ